MLYVCMEVGKWKDVDNVERLRRCVGVNKLFVKLIIVIDKKVFEFVVGV